MNSSGVRSIAPGLARKVADDKYIANDECAGKFPSVLLAV